MAGYREDAPDYGMFGHLPHMEEYTREFRFSSGFYDGVRHEKKQAEIPAKLSDPISPAYEAGYFAGRECVIDGSAETAEPFYNKFMSTLR